jgi:hypothetical protein
MTFVAEPLHPAELAAIEANVDELRVQADSSTKRLGLVKAAMALEHAVRWDYVDAVGEELRRVFDLDDDGVSAALRSICW